MRGCLAAPDPAGIAAAPGRAPGRPRCGARGSLPPPPPAAEPAGLSHRRRCRCAAGSRSAGLRSLPLPLRNSPRFPHSRPPPAPTSPGSIPLESCRLQPVEPGAWHGLYLMLGMDFENCIYYLRQIKCVGFLLKQSRKSILTCMVLGAKADEGAVRCSARVTRMLCCCKAEDEGCQARGCHVTASLPTGSVVRPALSRCPFSVPMRGCVGAGSAVTPWPSCAFLSKCCCFLCLVK